MKHDNCNNNNITSAAAVFQTDSHIELDAVELHVLGVPSSA